MSSAWGVEIEREWRVIMNKSCFTEFSKHEYNKIKFEIQKTNF